MLMEVTAYSVFLFRLEFGSHHSRSHVSVVTDELFGSETNVLTMTTTK